jgi:peptidoglycan-associated lipoprotein
MKKLLISVLLLNLLAACASQKPKEATTETPPPPAPVSESATPAEMAPGSSASPPPMMAMDPLNDPNSILARRSTYYPFDVYVVQNADKPLVQAHASYLSSHSNRKVRLEGNCDERGSDEYNLGLGQRRADGVKKMLLAGGVRESQIETVSYGEEKPRLTCHEEKCWKENRRTDLNYNVN